MTADLHAIYGALAGCWCVSFEPRSTGYRQRGSLLGPFISEDYNASNGGEPDCSMYHCVRCHETVLHEHGAKEVAHVCE